MDVKTKHPSLTGERLAEWKLMRATLDGESAIKRDGETYLTKPGGFKANPAAESALYAAYKSRAQFPEILVPSIAAMIGIVHGQEIDIQIRSLTKRLQEHLATHVSINHSTKKGKIEIEYYGNDDLDRILDILKLPTSSL